MRWWCYRWTWWLCSVGGIGSLCAPLPLADCMWHHSPPLFSTLERASEAVLLVVPGIGAIPLYAANWNDRYPVHWVTKNVNALVGAVSAQESSVLVFMRGCVWLGQLDCVVPKTFLDYSRYWMWPTFSNIKQSLSWVRLAWFFFPINLSCCVKLLH